MGHAHPHAEEAGRGLKIGLAVTVGILVVELVAGLWAHSLALLSDAGHELADTVSLGLALVAVVLAGRPADERRTYGYHRAGILAALGNAAILAVVVAAIVAEAIHRFSHPPQVQGQVVAIAAAVAVAANAYVAFGLRGSAGDLNVRAALAHVLGDLLGAGGALVAGLVILVTGFSYADPIASLLIAALIAWSVVRIAVETVNVLLEGAPRGLELEEVERAIRTTPGVRSVHDLHVWSIAPEHTALSCHVVVEGDSLAGSEPLVREVDSRLRSGFEIGHTTVQLEAGDGCPTDLEDAAHGGPVPSARERAALRRGARLPEPGSGGRRRRRTRRSSPSRGS